MKDHSGPTAASMARARALIDSLICQHCGGYIGDGPNDSDVSCMCRNAAHARMVRDLAARRQRLLMERYRRST